MSKAIPSTMLALVLDRYHDDVLRAIEGLRVVRRPTPAPGRGQVLVRVEAAPCNPSDLLLLQGKYGTLKTLPTAPGWEGAGTVVASGGGWLASRLMGKRVACGLQQDRDGTWAEFVLANAVECIPLKRGLSTEQGASLIINPLTAMAMLDTARRGGHRAAVHTAGASQLGRMLLAMAQECGYPIIHVVRREAQVELLKSLGAEWVLNASSEDFLQQLQTACARLHASAVFEAVAGDMTGAVINLMPPDSTAFVYGDLSGAPCGGISAIELIFREKTVTGFFLGQWLRRRGLLGSLRAANRVQRMLIEGRIQTKIQRRVGLEQAVEGLQQYVGHMTEGKVLITPHARPG